MSLDESSPARAADARSSRRGGATRLLGGTPDHPKDITTSRVRRLVDNVLGDPSRVSIAQSDGVFATGAMRGAKLFGGVSVLMVAARGLRQMNAVSIAPPGLHIEGRLTGTTRSRELTAPHRGSTIAEGMVKVTGIAESSKWSVEIPPQGSLSAVTIVYSREFLCTLAIMEPELARQALTLIDGRADQVLESENDQRLSFARLLYADPEQPGAKLRMEALARSILVDTLAALDQEHVPEVSGDRQLVAHALDVIEATLGHPPTIDGLAHSVRVSASRLKRVFHDTVGQSVGAYIASRRMEAAKELLHSDLPVSWVADEMGYATPEAFARAFRRHFGQSPRQYRASHD